MENGSRAENRIMWRESLAVLATLQLSLSAPTGTWLPWCRLAILQWSILELHVMKIKYLVDEVNEMKLNA